MAILCDSIISPNIDDTYFFLAEAFSTLKNVGVDVWFHPRSESPESNALNLPKAKYSSSFSNNELFEASLPAVEIIKIQSAYKAWGDPKPFSEIRDILACEIKLLKDFDIQGVIAWGSTHPQSVTLLSASRLSKVPSIVMERGLIPNSWTLFESEQWHHSSAREHDFPLQDSDAIKNHARKLLANPFEGKYSESIREDELFSISHNDKKVLFCTGSTLGARGEADITAHLAVNESWRALTKASRLAGISLQWRGHPADSFRPSPPPEIDISSFPFWEIAVAAKLLVCHSTNVWVYGILAGVQVIPVEVESARFCSISNIDFADFLDDGLDSAEFKVALNGLNISLREILNQELSTTHFYFFNEDFHCPGPQEFALHVAKMLNASVDINQYDSKLQIENYRRIVHYVNRDTREAKTKANMELLKANEEITKLTVELDTTINHLKHYRSSIEAIENSKFWKITRPIREILGRISRR